MAANLDDFVARWDVVSRETLSAVRREFNAYGFDDTNVERAFRSASDEWFVGSLGPHMWFEELEAEHPEKARELREYVSHIHFDKKSFSKPSRAIGYVLTILSLPLCYFGLNWLTDMGILSKALTTIATGVLVWYASLVVIKGRESKLEEGVVDFYRVQLAHHLSAIKEILS